MKCNTSCSLGHCDPVNLAQCTCKCTTLGSWRRKLERSWQYMPSYFIKKRIRDAAPRSICFICSQMEQDHGPLCQPVCLPQSITRMRNICGHCQRDNQGMFMITGGEREWETAIYQPDLSLSLSLNPPTHRLYIHSLPNRADPGSCF